MTIPEETLEPSAATAPPHLSTRSWRPFIARLHFYAGVLVAPFLIVAAVTGGLYAVSPVIEQVVYRDILVVEPSGSPLPLSEQTRVAVEAFPDLTMTGLRPAGGDTDSTRIYFADPGIDEESMRAVFVDPYRARVLGDEITWFGYLPLSTWLDGLHRHLNLGEPGRVYSELAASWLSVIAIGGLYLWLVKARSDKRRGRRPRVLTVDRTTEGRQRTLNWHGATGVWLLAGLLFLSATGITWSTYAGAHVTELRTALNWQRPQLDTATSHAGHGDNDMSHDSLDPTAVDYNRVLEAASGAGVHLPVEVTLPGAAGDGIGVTEIDKPYRLTTNAAAVDAHTYSVTDEVDYWRDYSPVAMLADWGIRAHMGFLFGLLNQLLLLGIAVGLLSVIVRGYRMWWQRRPTRGSDWAVGRPPMRGGLLRLHPVTLAAITVATIAVGWFLPILGISLAAFVVADAVIGVVKKRRHVGTRDRERDR